MAVPHSSYAFAAIADKNFAACRFPPQWCSDADEGDCL